MGIIRAVDPLLAAVVPREEAAALGEEARRLDRSPLDLLLERGKISAETHAELRRAAAPDPDATAPLHGRGLRSLVAALLRGALVQVALAAIFSALPR